MHAGPAKGAGEEAAAQVDGPLSEVLTGLSQERYILPRL